MQVSSPGQGRSVLQVSPVVPLALTGAGCLAQQLQTGPAAPPAEPAAAALKLQAQRDLQQPQRVDPEQAAAHAALVLVLAARLLAHEACLRLVLVLYLETGRAALLTAPAVWLLLC